MVNSHLVCDPTIRQPGFDHPRQQWSLLNRFRTEQGQWTLRCLQKEMAIYSVLVQGRFYVGAGGAQAPPNVGQAPQIFLVPTAKIRIVKI